MLKEIILSVQSYFMAHKFISQNRLWGWIIIPGIIYILIFGAGIYFFWITAAEAIQLIMTETGIREWLETMKEGWLNFFVIVAHVIVWLTLLFFYFSIFKYFFLIIGAPLFAWLSERSEAILTGKDFPFSFLQLMKDAWRAVKISVRNFFWQTIYLLALLLFSFVPVIGWIAPLIAFLVECYYFGFAMLDYSFERHKIQSKNSIRFIGRHKGLAIGNGVMFFALHFIPILGWLIAPSYAVIAATLSLMKYNEGDKIIFEKE